MVTKKPPVVWGPPPPGVRDPRIWRARRTTSGAVFFCNSPSVNEAKDHWHPIKFTGFATDLIDLSDGPNKQWTWELVGCLLSIEDIDE